MANSTSSAPRTSTDWSDLASQVLAGHALTEAEGLAVLACPDEQLLELMAAAYRVRRRHFGNKVQLYFLMNAKSGLCQEDCGYCSQSKISSADIPRYNLLGREQVLAAAQAAADRQAGTFCLVISGRAPTERELTAVEELVPEIKEKFDLHVCACLGLLNHEQAVRLKACGVDRVNHNVNTSAEFHDQICSTHTHADRLATLQAVRDAGIELCSGGILGMGEQPLDIVRMAMQLRALNVESVPINFLNPIDGTPLSGTHHLTPTGCLKALALFRLVHPDREIRIAGGREMHLGHLQPLGLYAANSLFVGDYLTTKGQPPQADLDMIAQMGFEVA